MGETNNESLFEEAQQLASRRKKEIAQIFINKFISEFKTKIMNIAEFGGTTLYIRRNEYSNNDVPWTMVQDQICKHIRSCGPFKAYSTDASEYLIVSWNTNEKS